MRSGEIEISGGEENKLTAYFEDPDEITLDILQLLRLVQSLVLSMV